MKKVPKNTKRKDSKRSFGLGNRLEKKVTKMGGKELNYWPKSAQKRNPYPEQKAGERTLNLQALNGELSSKVNELEAKIFELQQTQNKLNRLASFPEMNPNPVVEVNVDGSIEYLNPAAKKLFPNLQDMGRQHEWLVDLESIRTLLKDQEKTSYAREIKINGNWYQQSFHLTPGVDHIRIYGLDITERKQTDEALRDSEERLLVAQQVAHVGTFEWNIHTGVNRWTPELEAMYGLQPGDFARTQPAWEQLVHPEDHDEAERRVNEAFETGGPTEGEWRVVWPDGSLHWLAGRWQVFKDEVGNPLRMTGVNIDITERKRAEEALRESEERFRAVFESSFDCILVWDRQYNYLYANQAAIDHVGTTRDKVIGKNIRDGLGHIPDFMYLWMERVDRAFATGEPFRVEDAVPVGGQLVYSESQISPIRDATGQVFAVGVVYRDVTERKQMEEELRKSRDELEIRVQQRTAELAKANELLQRMFSSTGIMIAYMDKDFNFIRVNRAYAEADERKPDFFIGKNHFALFPKEENEQIFRKVVETGEPYSVYAKPFEYVEHPERGVTHWDWSLQPVKDPDGSIGGVVLSLVNVTERIRAQEAVVAERQRFNEVLEILPAYLVLLSPDYHVPFANRFFRDRFGESHGKRCFEYLFGRSEPCEICETYTVLKTNAPHHWEWTGPDGRNYDVFDFPFTDSDGTTLILEMGIDITERKKAEEAVRAASLYTRSLIEASLDPLVTISGDGKIMDVNSATELTTGVLRDELIGTDFSNYFTEPEKAREGYQRVFREGFVKDYPLAIRHVSGKVTDVLYHATVYKNEVGEIQGVFAAARDITERKRMEKELRESENRLRLLSSQLLSVQEAERKRIAREIHDSIGQTLAAIKFGLESKLSQMGAGAPPPGVSIENIISLAQSGIEESRRIQMDLRPSILDDLGILATIGWFTREFQKVYSHISVEKQISVEENEIPDSLKTTLFRVMQEAMNNIAKHSKAELVRLILTKTAGKIELSVEDNGAGFDPENIKQGLGLTSMRERTELSRGSLEIESIPGKGTTIKASWPL
jgi:PAS domain S-box-containing protein